LQSPKYYEDKSNLIVTSHYFWYCISSFIYDNDVLNVLKDWIYENLLVKTNSFALQWYQEINEADMELMNTYSLAAILLGTGQSILINDVYARYENNNDSSKCYSDTTVFKPIESIIKDMI